MLEMTHACAGCAGGDLLARTPVRPAEGRGGGARPLHSPSASGGSLHLHMPTPSPARLPQVPLHPLS